MSLHPTPGLVVPQSRMFIPAGKFIDIDAKYYQPQDKQVFLKHESYGNQGQPLQSHSVRYDQPIGFVKQSHGLALDDGRMKVNYRSYIYQQLTGFQ